MMDETTQTPHRCPNCLSATLAYAIPHGWRVNCLFCDWHGPVGYTAEEAVEKYNRMVADPAAPPSVPVATVRQLLLDAAGAADDRWGVHSDAATGATFVEQYVAERLEVDR